jgi:S1-C subfamily serine protease
MDGFGVQRPALKALAETPTMPKVEVTIDTTPRTAEEAAPPIPWMGAEIRRPRGEEMSAYGVSFDTQGIAVEEIERRSALGGPQGLRKGDLLLELNGNRITSIEDLRKALESVKDGKLRLRVIRSQEEATLELEVNDLRSP